MYYLKIAAVGFCCFDIYEELGQSYPTGNGINVVVNLSKRGVETAAVCGIGNDDYGKQMLKMLSDFGVNTSYMHPQNGETSRFYMKIAEDGDRIHLKNVPGVMDYFRLTEDDIVFLQDYDYIHTDLFGQVLDDLSHLREKGAKVVFDFSTFADDENMHRLLPNIDYAFFSAESRKDDVAEFLRYAKSLGGQVVTATFGDRGSLSYDGQKFYRQGIVNTNVVNTCGAGDAYISGFVYGLLQGHSIQDCMRIGAETAATIVARFKPY